MLIVSIEGERFVSPNEPSASIKPSNQKGLIVIVDIRLLLITVQPEFIPLIIALAHANLSAESRLDPVVYK